MASLRERSASRSENSCPSNSAIFRSAGCAWSRSAIPKPVVNSFLPLASPRPHNSTPSPVWYTVCDVACVACAREGLLLSREAPVSAHHSKNLHIGHIAKVEPRMRILVREAHVVLSIVAGLSVRRSARRCRADILQDLRSRSLRVGYSVSSEAASRLSALRLQNGVTIVSAKAAIAALEDGAYVRMADET